jgi:hypothetical protein
MSRETHETDMNHEQGVSMPQWFLFSLLGFAVVVVLGLFAITNRIETLSDYAVLREVDVIANSTLRQRAGVVLEASRGQGARLTVLERRVDELEDALEFHVGDGVVAQ